jgi:hypothetical protein
MRFVLTAAHPDDGLDARHDVAPPPRGTTPGTGHAGHYPIT